MIICTFLVRIEWLQGFAGLESPADRAQGEYPFSWERVMMAIWTQMAWLLGG